MGRLAAALSPVNLLNSLASTAPVSSEDGLPYGAGARQRLDLYRPQQRGNLPVVVFFYGGAWAEGDRAMYRFVGTALAAAGFLTVIPDYRVFPEVRFPGFVEDAALATRWAEANAVMLGGDPDRLVLMGHSAGAHIAALLALDPRWLDRAGVDHRRLRGLVGLAGPYDFESNGGMRRQIFAPARDYAETQPISFASAAAPPSLLASGQKDRVVDPGNSRRLAAKLRAAGAQVDLALYPHPSHESLIGAFSPALRFLAPVFRDCVRFVETVTRRPLQLERHAA